MQPNLGTTLIIVADGVSLLFLAGLSWCWIAPAVAAVAARRSAGLAISCCTITRSARVMTFLDPEAMPLGAGWNITQAKIAIGSGGLSGKGFLKGTQSRLNFLPEKQTDFIFTNFGEEFGFVGCIALLILFAVVIGYGIQIAMASRSQFARLLAMGITLNFFFYIMINGAMVMGLIPGGRHSHAADVLWRHRHADGDVRLRPVDERACPSPGGNSPPFRRNYLIIPRPSQTDRLAKTCLL